jgi:hypothetical protein
MFDINKFLYKLRARSMYTSIFKSKSKREASAMVRRRFESMNTVFARVSRSLSRLIDVFLASCRRTKNQEQVKRNLIERAWWFE